MTHLFPGRQQTGVINQPGFQTLFQTENLKKGLNLKLHLSRDAASIAELLELRGLYTTPPMFPSLPLIAGSI